MTARRGRGLLLTVLVLLLAPLIGSLQVTQAQERTSDQIAYLRDGNLWLAGTNGSDQRALTDGASYNVRQRPALSPDGSLLALDGGGTESGITIWSLSDGESWMIPGSEFCGDSQYTDDGQRLTYFCPHDGAGLMMSSAVDGTDQQMELPWPDDPGEVLGGVVNMRRSDGMFLLEQLRDVDEGQGSLPTIAVVDSDLNEIAAFEGVEINGELQHPFAVRLAPEGDQLIGTLCVSGCTYREESVYQDFLIDFEGNALGRLTPDWMGRRAGYNISWPAVASLPLLDLAATVEESSEAAPIVPADFAPEPDAAGWIAYVDAGGVWIMRPDGSEPTRLTDDPPGNARYADAGQISWSHDGAMLAFNGPTDPTPILDETRGIWIYRNDQAFRLPNTEHCAFPAFSADNTRLFYTCWGANLDPGNEAGLDDDPTMAFLTSSAIDGSDQRAVIRYTDAPPHETWLADDGTFLQGEAVDVNPLDGSVLVRYSGQLGQSSIGTILYDDQFEQVLVVPTEQHDDGTATGMYREFMPDGRVAAFTMCLNLCENGRNTLVRDHEGNEYDQPIFGDALFAFLEFSLSPDGLSAIGATAIDGTWIISEVGLTGTFNGFEREFAWQPVPVRIGPPVGPPVDLEPVEASESEDNAGTETAEPETTDEAEAAGTDEEEAAAEQPEGAGWIAYAAHESEGGAIWLRRPDGSESVRITEDLPFDVYRHPAWSHDGTMLAFSGPMLISDQLGPYQGIWVLRDGELSLLPNTNTCLQPLFSADNERIYYQCWALGFVGDATPAELQNNPLYAVVASSALDGSDQRTELAFADEFEGGGFYDPAGNRLVTSAIDVNPEDGSLLVVMFGMDDGNGQTFEAVLHFDADLNLIARHDTIGTARYTTSSGYERLELTPLTFFLPEGEIGFIEYCPEDCGDRSELTLVDADGNELPYELVAAGYSVDSPFSQDLSPDGDRILIRQEESPYGTLILDEDGTVVPFAVGSYPAWQPVPVEIDLP